MTRDRSPNDDTFERFQPRERGRFGDNEFSDIRGNDSVRSDLVDLKLTLRMDNPQKKAIAVQRIGEHMSDWIWLPRSLIDYRNLGPDIVMVTLSKRLAKEKGLI